MQIKDTATEVIAVDDGSEDESLAILRRYETLHPEFRILTQENRGAAGARNSGLKAASGEYVWFVDPDDHIAEGALGSIDQALTGPDTAGADVLFFDAYEERGRRQKPWEHFPEDRDLTSREEILTIQRGMLYSPEAGTDTPLAAPWDKIFRRSFLADHDLWFPENLRVLDDMVFNLRVFGVAGKVSYRKIRIYRYVRNSAGITASYTPDRIAKDHTVWEEIRSYLRKCDEKQGYSLEDRKLLYRAFLKRILKSYAISLKLQTFHPRNPQSLSEKLRSAVSLTKMPCYREAFQRTKINGVEWKLKPVLFLGKILSGRVKEVKQLFITTKNLDYIRNVQEIRMLRKASHHGKVIGSGSGFYPIRLLSVYLQLLFTDFHRYHEIFVGFAPQLVLPLFGKRIRRAGAKLTEDFFISFYDTLCNDRKIFRPGSRMGQWLHRLDEGTIRMADEVICDTRAHADWFAAEFGADCSRLKVMYLEADRRIYHPEAVDITQEPHSSQFSHKPEILYFGSVLPLQGTDIVLTAMKRLAESGDFHCVFIGPVKRFGSRRSGRDFRKQILDSGIEMIPRLSQKDLAKRIARADLCLAGHFSNNIDKAKRTIPGKAFIYEAMKKPMILGDNPANREYFIESPTVRFVSMGDPDALELCIRDLFAG